MGQDVSRSAGKVSNVVVKKVEYYVFNGVSQNLSRTFSVRLIFQKRRKPVLRARSVHESA